MVLLRVQYLNKETRRRGQILIHPSKALMDRFPEPGAFFLAVTQLCEKMAGDSKRAARHGWCAHLN